jgi:DNA-binding MarR family transcriptional regulator
MPSQETDIEIDKNQVINDLIEIGYNDEKAVKSAINVLLNESLLESLQGIEEQDAEALSITPKGKKYLELMYEYSYILFICDAVPKENKYNRIGIKEKFGTDFYTILNRGDI